MLKLEDFRVSISWSLRFVQVIHFVANFLKSPLVDELVGFLAVDTDFFLLAGSGMYMAGFRLLYLLPAPAAVILELLNILIEWSIDISGPAWIFLRSSRLRLDE